MILRIACTTILAFCGIEIIRVIVFCYFKKNGIDVMSKRLVFSFVMNMYARFHTFSIIEVEVSSVKTKVVL